LTANLPNDIGYPLEFKDLRWEARIEEAGVSREAWGRQFRPAVRLEDST